MAHTISGVRNIRKNAKRRSRNKGIKSALRTQIRKVIESVEKKDKVGAQKNLQAVYQLLDRAAQKGVIHSNSAARHKSRLALGVADLK